LPACDTSALCIIIKITDADRLPSVEGNLRRILGDKRDGIQDLK
jgi:hypothetical protein